jgi:glucosyl-3-phosphoglycerate synthase
VATPPASPPEPGHAPVVDVDDLVARKQARGLGISVCLPARNEEATVGHIVATIRRTLMELVPLVDEVVVIDDRSTDATAEAAAWEGARVFGVDEVLPGAPRGSGKGNALWTSLYAAEGDLVCWLDADVRNFGSHFVTGLLAPLVNDPDVAFVKGYYRRPLHAEPTGGGRVTELMARPLLSVLFPELTGFIQPLGGEYAGRRDVLEAVPFVEGWGVEIGLLVDIVRQFGLGAVAQVDLGVREHRNRPLDELGAQATAILATALRRAGLTDADAATLTRFTEAFEVERIAIDTSERPPIIELPEYCEKFAHREPCRATG